MKNKTEKAHDQLKTIYLYLRSAMNKYNRNIRSA